MLKYSIVIVTYNRIELLKECLKHALNQTLPAEHIIVVDNCSTDGTKEYLQEYLKTSEKICVVSEKSNIGGAGGFHDGLKYAYDNTDSEWYMLIDDDAMLDHTCMEEIDKHYNSKYLACACKVLRAGEIEMDRRNFSSSSPLPKEEYEKATCECENATFCGLMVNRKLVKEIGFPKPEYFIWFDDVEYCMRFIPYTKIEVVSSAVLDHRTKPRPTAHGQDVFSWKDYYGFRNMVDAYLCHKWYKEFIKLFFNNLARAAYRGIKSVKYKEDLGSKIILDGTFDGIRHKLGINPKYFPGKK